MYLQKNTSFQRKKPHPNDAAGGGRPDWRPLFLTTSFCRINWLSKKPVPQKDVRDEWDEADRYSPHPWMKPIAMH